MEIRIKTIGDTYVATEDDYDGDDMKGLAELFGQVLGQEPNAERYLVLKDDTRGWVALNPAHVISVELGE